MAIGRVGTTPVLASGSPPSVSEQAEPKTTFDEWFSRATAHSGQGLETNAKIGAIALGVGTTAQVAKSLKVERDVIRLAKIAAEGPGARISLRETAELWSQAPLELLAKSAANAGTKFSPAMIATVAGAAAADGLMYVAPDLVPKMPERATEPTNSHVRLRRGVGAAAVVGALAAPLYIWKPNLFRKMALYGDRVLLEGLTTPSTPWWKKAFQKTVEFGSIAAPVTAVPAYWAGYKNLDPFTEAGKIANQPTRR